MKSVLAAFAHPDDAELTCFGTLGLLQSRGYRVLVGIITDGTAGLPCSTSGRVHCATSARKILSGTPKISARAAGAGERERT